MRTTFLFLLALCATPAIANTETYISGDCEEGTYSKWWEVVEKNGAGQTICTTSRDCYGSVTSDCPTDEDDDPGQWGGIVPAQNGYPTFSPGSGDTVWAVYEHNSSGTVIGVVYKNSVDGLIHSSFDGHGYDGIAPAQGSGADRNLLVDPNVRIDPMPRETPELRPNRGPSLNDVPQSSDKVRRVTSTKIN